MNLERGGEERVVVCVSCARGLEEILCDRRTFCSKHDANREHLHQGRVCVLGQTRSKTGGSEGVLKRRYDNPKQAKERSCLYIQSGLGCNSYGLFYVFFESSEFAVCVYIMDRERT